MVVVMSMAGNKDLKIKIIHIFYWELYMRVIARYRSDTAVIQFNKLPGYISLKR